VAICSKVREVEVVLNLWLINVLDGDAMVCRVGLNLSLVLVLEAGVSRCFQWRK
jgi:hypothetical protein